MSLRAIGKASAGVAGIPLCALGATAVITMLNVRPLPALSLCASGAVLALGVVGVRLAASGHAKPGKRIWHGVAVVFVVLALLVLPALQCACQRAPLGSSTQGARTAALIQRQDWPGAPTPHDAYGRPFHIRTLPDNRLLIWSDGPDSDDDNAAPLVLGDLSRFERAFASVYFAPVMRWQMFLRGMALAELVHIWGRFDGDLVWEDDNGAIRWAESPPSRDPR